MSHLARGSDTMAQVVISFDIVSFTFCATINSKILAALPVENST